MPPLLHPERRRLSRAKFAAILAGVFFALSLVGILHHEMWRDEYQAWLVARDAHSIPELLQNVKYEGNPALWHLVLFAVTAASRNPFAMQLVHILISTAMVAVLARYAALPPLHKVLFAFGYPAFFEFNLISRGYALGLLFLTIFCALYQSRDRHLVTCAVVLALMANCSPFALMLSATCGSLLIFDQLLRRGRGKARVRLAIAVALLVAGWAVSVAQILPEPDNAFPVRYAPARLDASLLAFAVSRILAAYLPIPPLSSVHFWNRTVFDDWPALPRVVLSLALFAVFALGFLRKRAIALLYAGGTGLLLAFFYETGMAAQRYCLHLVVLLVTCFCLERHHGEDLRQPQLLALSRRVRPWAGFAFLGLLAGGAFAGAWAVLADLRLPFSSSLEAAALIREKGCSDLPIVGHTDFIVSPLSAILDKPIYYPERGAYGSFIVWDLARRRVTTFDDIAAAFTFMLSLGERHFLWVADTQPTLAQDWQRVAFDGGDDLVRGVDITLLGTIPPGIVSDEHYVIYRVDKLDLAAVR